MKYSDTVRKEGRKRLKKLLPQAIKAAKAMAKDESFKPHVSQRGDAVIRYAKPSNIEALVVYRTERGWYADIILKKVPVGVSNVMGTPVDHPHSSKADAEKEARALLKMTIAMQMNAKQAARDASKADMRVFKLHGREFSFPGDVVDATASALARVGEATAGTAADARARLEMNLAKIMGGPGFDDEKWEAASDEDRMKCLANMVTLLCHAETLHPEPVFPEVIDDMQIN